MDSNGISAEYELGHEIGYGRDPKENKVKTDVGRIGVRTGRTWDDYWIYQCTRSSSQK